MRLESRIVWRQLLVRCVTAGIMLVLCAACGSESPSAPASTPPASGTTAHSRLDIVSITVIAESLAPGFAYRTVVHLKETGGIAAKIASVDLRFSSGATAVASLHDEQPIVENLNIVPANTAVDTRELLTVDSYPSHSPATIVRATVTYSDTTSTIGTSEGSADVAAPIALPPAQIHTLTGIIGDDGTHRGIGGARVQVISGANLGMEATADASGRYSLEQLAAGAFRLRAFAGGYDPGEQNITVPANAQADFLLRPSAGCFYTVPPGLISVTASGGARSFTATPSAATCRWRASASDSWITLTGATSGTGAATISYTVAPNNTVSFMIGNIAVEWPSGRVEAAIFQYPLHTNCPAAINYTVPAAGWRSYITLSAGCYFGHEEIDVPWIHIRGTHGGATFVDTEVDANSGAARTGHITYSDERVYTRITISQEAAR
jgi:hypothetical protein